MKAYRIALVHRVRFGHWPTVTLTDTGACLFCSMQWNPERGYWEVRATR